MTEGEGLLTGLAIAAGIFVLVAIMFAALKRQAPPAPTPPLLPSWPAQQPYVSPEVQAAVAQANASGRPFDFIVVNPATGQPIVMRAFPGGAIQPATGSPYPYPALPPHFPI